MGDLACFCKYLHEQGREYLQTTFEDVDPTDQTLYCKKWRNYEAVEFSIKFLVPLFIVFTNALVTNFYYMLVQWWIPCISTVNESLVKFWGIVIYEALNLALMFILATVFLDLWSQRDTSIVDLNDVFTH